MFTEPDLQQKFENTLRQDERVLWTFENAKGSAWYKARITYGLVFAIVWVVMMSFITLPLAIGWAFGASPIYILPIFFFVIGIVMLLTMIWGVGRMNSFAYAVTDQRVLVMNSCWPQGIRTYGPKDITALHSTGGESFGHVSLNSLTMPAFRRFDYGDYFLPPKLANIPNAKDVEALIYDTLLNPSKRTAA